MRRIAASIVTDKPARPRGLRRGWSGAWLRTGHPAPPKTPVARRSRRSPLGTATS